MSAAKCVWRGILRRHLEKIAPLRPLAAAA
jgi:hypothetical protein